MKQSIAPINAILEYKNHVIMAMGQTVRIDNTTFEFERNIYSLKIIDNQLVAFGTKLLVIINVEKLTVVHKECCNSVICDVKYENDIFYCLTMRGEVFGLTRNDGNYTKVLTATSTFSITAGKFFGNGFVGGTWNGNILYNDNKYEIQLGTVYDISYNNDYIISCSTDRSICVYNHEFTVKYRVYDYRTRIYKCGFLGYKAIIDKFVAWHNRKNNKTGIISVSDLFYYGITEKGKLKVFCNDDCIYELKSTSNRIICATEIDNEFIVGYDNGEHGEIKLHSIEQVSGSEREEILPYICSNNKYGALPTISEHINKIKAIGNTIYASVKNILYEYLDNKLEYVDTFSSYIIEIYENVIVTVEDTIVTADRHKEIVYAYTFRNITTAYKTFIGTRKGLLIYKDIAIAISNDAISGILEYRNDLFMSCKDGNMYMLSDIDKLCKTYDYVVEQEVISRYKIVQYPIYKKTICSAFLEGMLKCGSIYTYSFSKSCLMLYSAGSINPHYIGTKPSHYYFKGNTFYYLEHGILYKINFGEKGRNMMKGEFTNVYIDNGRSFYVSDTELTYKYQNHSDSLNCEDVSCMVTFNDLCFVGTLDGCVRIIKIINNQLWQVAEHKSMHRIMDLIVTNDKNCLTVYCSDSFGVLKILHFTDDSLQCKASKSFGILFTSLALYENSIIAGTADGDILTLSMDLKLISNEHVHHASVTKVLSFTSQGSNSFASGSDDHRLIIFNSKTKHCQEFEMPSRVIDILFIHSICVLACLTTDRTVTIIDCEQNKIVSAKKVKIYNPCKLAFDNELIVVGQGVDRIKI